MDGPPGHAERLLGLVDRLSGAWFGVLLSAKYIGAAQVHASELPPALRGWPDRQYIRQYIVGCFCHEICKMQVLG